MNLALLVLLALALRHLAPMPLVPLAELAELPRGHRATPELAARLRRAAAELAELGIDLWLYVTSSFRDPARQRELYERHQAAVADGARRGESQADVERRIGIYRPARPGRSRHETGRAVDVSPPAELAELVAAALKAAGLRQPLPDTDPVHWELPA